MTLAVRYCTTPGGRVAWTAQGSGPALLLDPGWITDLRRQPELWGFGAFVDRLAERFRVLRYDRPGCGLSDRGDVDMSFAAQRGAALAVLDAAGADHATLFGASQGGQVAAALTADHPDRVDAVVLYGTCARGSDLAPAAVRASLVDLVRAHWGLGFKALAGAFVTDPTPAELDQLAAFQRAGASAGVAAAMLAGYYDGDVRDALRRIRVPTAVLHRTDDRGTPFALGREVAALVPGAVLVPLSGTSHLYYHGDWGAVADAALGFLAGVRPAVPELTPRETEIAALVADGLTNGAIAHRLGIAPRTSETHVENIRRKLGVRSRAQIAAWATERRLSR